MVWWAKVRPYPPRSLVGRRFISHQLHECLCAKRGRGARQTTRIAATNTNKCTRQIRKTQTTPPPCQPHPASRNYKLPAEKRVGIITAPYSGRPQWTDCLGAAFAIIPSKRTARLQYVRLIHTSNTHTHSHVLWWAALAGEGWGGLLKCSTLALHCVLPALDAPHASCIELG